MHDINYPASVAPGEIHIWRVWLPEWGGSAVAALMEFLSQEEHSKTQRYVFDRDKKRAAISRGLLRVLVGRYLNQPPAALKFTYTEYGKPLLAEEFAASGLCFNLSHAEHALVYAFAQNQQVGLDVEEVRSLPDLTQLAGSFLTAAEATFLQQLPLNRQLDEFYHLWTTKEAYLKATGHGLSGALDAVEFGKICAVPGVAPRWSIYNLPDPYSNYKAALVSEKFCPTRGWFSFSPDLLD